MLRSKDIELLLVHAALQVQYQKPEHAISILDAVLEIDPQHKEAMQTLAVACLQSDRYARAVEVCELLLKSDLKPDSAGLWFCLSQARWKQNDVDGARQAHRRYLQSLNSESHE
ncbi:type III secretion system chaperone VscY [Vibrio diabolicus]|uniref:type III secretion system chaperone VscY n=1 Tax=Vibrio diabolicus TaxID=50719 RepID=UPI002160FBEB|nr:type III secretion system chaperone VscY [Vibrio diabolicus]MCS0379663.1 type III secretion system chaperone VscY [Vibrio diabolicus]MCS0421612.1 type III secretion system chaperone VscY [Vibrio diabolicus]